ncbi:MAG: C13 family peptidase [Dongiaceae bacterium]
MAALIAGLQIVAGRGYRMRLQMPQPDVLGVSVVVLAALCAFGYLLARLHRNSVGGAGVVIIVASAAILPTLAFATDRPVMMLLLWGVGYGHGSLWLGHAVAWLIYLPMMWFIATFIRSVSIACGVGVPRAFMLSIVPFLVLALSNNAAELWSRSKSSASADVTAAEVSPSPRIDAEQIFYSQPDQVAQAVAGLLPERPGVTDLYLVAFAGYARQNVFRSEVEKVTALFDARFDTKGRSVVLVNNAETVERTPIASATNLKHVLAGVAARMNRDEDVLFLFLTSHGSPQSFAVEFSPLWLNSISPADLDRMLDEAGIKWRIVVVSACYSGGFVEPLKDDNSLIITAARADRNSFGCSNENEYTFFGDAYFNQELRRQSSFIAAFDGAAAAIAKRERAEDLQPSEPQIYVGPAIRAKLAEFERRLSAGPAVSPEPGG